MCQVIYLGHSFIKNTAQKMEYVSCTKTSNRISLYTITCYNGTSDVITIYYTLLETAHFNPASTKKSIGSPPHCKG